MEEVRLRRASNRVTLSMICRLRRPWTEAVVVLGVDAVLVYRKRRQSAISAGQSESIHSFISVSITYPVR